MQALLAAHMYKSGTWKALRLPTTDAHFVARIQKTGELLAKAYELAKQVKR